MPYAQDQYDLLLLRVLSAVPGCHTQFELRYNEVDRARAVFERYVEVLPSVKAWVRYAKFELQHNDVSLARSCYERAMEALGEDSHTVSFLCARHFVDVLARDRRSVSCYLNLCSVCRKTCSSALETFSFHAQGCLHMVRPALRLFACVSCYERAMEALGEDSHTLRLILRTCEGHFC
jgi:hypothetical protein